MFQLNVVLSAHFPLLMFNPLRHPSVKKTFFEIFWLLIWDNSDIMLLILNTELGFSEMKKPVH